MVLGFLDFSFRWMLHGVVCLLIVPDARVSWSVVIGVSLVVSLGLLAFGVLRGLRCCSFSVGVWCAVV